MALDTLPDLDLPETTNPLDLWDRADALSEHELRSEDHTQTLATTTGNGDVPCGPDDHDHGHVTKGSAWTRTAVQDGDVTRFDVVLDDEDKTVNVPKGAYVHVVEVREGVRWVKDKAGTDKKPAKTETYTAALVRWWDGEAEYEAWTGLSNLSHNRKLTEDEWDAAKAAHQKPDAPDFEGAVVALTDMDRANDAALQGYRDNLLQQGDQPLKQTRSGAWSEIDSTLKAPLEQDPGLVTQVVQRVHDAANQAFFTPEGGVQSGHQALTGETLTTLERRLASRTGALLGAKTFADQVRAEWAPKLQKFADGKEHTGPLSVFAKRSEDWKTLKKNDVALERATRKRARGKDVDLPTGPTLSGVQQMVDAAPQIQAELQAQLDGLEAADPRELQGQDGLAQVPELPDAAQVSDLNTLGAALSPYVQVGGGSVQADGSDAAVAQLPDAAERLDASAQGWAHLPADVRDLLASRPDLMVGLASAVQGHDAGQSGALRQALGRRVAALVAIERWIGELAAFWAPVAGPFRDSSALEAERGRFSPKDPAWRALKKAERRARIQESKGLAQLGKLFARKLEHPVDLPGLGAIVEHQEQLTQALRAKQQAVLSLDPSAALNVPEGALSLPKVSDAAGLQGVKASVQPLLELSGQSLGWDGLLSEGLSPNAKQAGGELIHSATDAGMLDDGPLILTELELDPCDDVGPVWLTLQDVPLLAELDYRLMAGPGPDTGAASELHVGDRLELLGPLGEDWIRVMGPGGVEGFVHADLVNDTAVGQELKQRQDHAREQKKQAQLAEDHSDVAWTPDAAPLDPVGLDIRAWLVIKNPDHDTPYQTGVFTDDAGGSLTTPGQDWCRLIAQTGVGSAGQVEVLAGQRPVYVDGSLVRPVTWLDLAMNENSLGPEDVLRARKELASASFEGEPGRRAAYYERLMDLVALDPADAATFTHADHTGGMGILAGALHALGVPNPAPGISYGDALERVRLEQDIPIDQGPAWTQIAATVGVQGTHVGSPTPDALRDALRTGHTVMVQDGDKHGFLRQITDKGLVVEDLSGGQRVVKSADQAWTFAVSSDVDGDADALRAQSQAAPLEVDEISPAYQDRLYPRTDNATSDWYLDAVAKSEDAGQVVSALQAYVPTQSDAPKYAQTPPDKLARVTRSFLSTAGDPELLGTVLDAGRFLLATGNDPDVIAKQQPTLQGVVATRLRLLLRQVADDSSADPWGPAVDWIQRVNDEGHLDAPLTLRLEPLRDQLKDMLVRTSHTEDGQDRRAQADALEETREVERRYRASLIDRIIEHARGQSVSQGPDGELVVKQTDQVHETLPAALAEDLVRSGNEDLLALLVGRAGWGVDWGDAPVAVDDPLAKDWAQTGTGAGLFDHTQGGLGVTHKTGRAVADLIKDQSGKAPTDYAAWSAGQGFDPSTSSVRETPDKKLKAPKTWAPTDDTPAAEDWTTWSKSVVLDDDYQRHALSSTRGELWTQSMARATERSQAIAGKGEVPNPTVDPTELAILYASGGSPEEMATLHASTAKFKPQEHGTIYSQLFNQMATVQDESDPLSQGARAVELYRHFSEQGSLSHSDMRAELGIDAPAPSWKTGDQAARELDLSRVPPLAFDAVYGDGVQRDMRGQMGQSEAARLRDQARQLFEAHTDGLDLGEWLQDQVRSGTLDADDALRVGQAWDQGDALHQAWIEKFVAEQVGWTDASEDVDAWYLALEVAAEHHRESVSIVAPDQGRRLGDGADKVLEFEDGFSLNVKFWGQGEDAPVGFDARSRRKADRGKDCQGTSLEQMRAFGVGEGRFHAGTKIQVGTPRDKKALRKQQRKGKIFNEYTGGRVQIDPSKAEEAVLYLREELAAGRPVLAGLSYAGMSAYNEGITDHFVPIIGHGADERGEFFTYNEVATRLGTGTTEDAYLNNRFYVEDDFRLVKYLTDGKGKITEDSDVTFFDEARSGGHKDLGTSFKQGVRNNATGKDHYPSATQRRCEITVIYKNKGP